MKYSINGNSLSHLKASFTVKENKFDFGITKDHDNLANPVELLLGSFAACCLKNVERFSDILHFDYESARIEIIGDRQEKPTKLIAIKYIIYIKSKDQALNLELLHKNIQKYGTIYNTLKETISISGEVLIEK